MDYFEQAINNYSGLSSETKPTLAAGNRVPNGSRWREVDTGKVHYFDSATDTWWELQSYIPPIGGAAPVIDMRVLTVLESCETILKKIEYHLMLASDADLTHDEV